MGRENHFTLLLTIDPLIFFMDAGGFVEMKRQTDEDITQVLVVFYCFSLFLSLLVAFIVF